MIPLSHLSKTPSELPKDKTENHVKDLSKLTKVQLLEIKEREKNLLSNKAWLARLPDKGERIRNFYNKVLKELQSRDEIEKAAELFSDLNIASTGQNKITTLEWTGKIDPSNHDEAILDSDDDDEIDPLKILAQSRNLEKRIKYIKPEKPLITDEDLKEIDSFKKNEENDLNTEQNENIDENAMIETEIVNIDIKDKLPSIKAKLGANSVSSSSQGSSQNSINVDPHVLYLFEKSVDESPQKERFKPYRTTKNNVHDPEKEKLRKPLGKHWEITAATPPPIQNAGTKLLSLQDSVEIQFDYLAKLEKLQEKQAEERLQAKMARMQIIKVKAPDENARKLNEFFKSYRDVGDNSSSDSEMECDKEGMDSDEGIRDDDEEKGGVVFPVYDS